MKRKKIPAKKHKGILIYCSKCSKHYSWTAKREGGTTKEPACGITKKRLSSCPNPEKQKYKVRVHIPGTLKGRVSKVLNASNYAEAILQSVTFEQEFLAQIKGPTEELSNPNLKLFYLFNTQISYLDFIQNIDVPEHQKIYRSEKHIKEQKKCLVLFNEALSKNGINRKLITIDKISDIHVGYFHDYLINNMKYANKTYNNKIGALKSFYDWAIEKYELNTPNPFNKARRRSSVIKKETISKDEFLNLLKIITPENGEVITKGKNRDYKRNLYRPFLIDGLKLALHTGGRREEVVDLKWNMIKHNKTIPTYFSVRNLKVERQAGDGFNENIAPKIIPITESLMNLLLDLGYESKKNSNEFILCPDRTETSTATIMDLLSKGFSHFYKKLNTGRELHFKCLRKTYLTYLDIAMKTDTKKLSSHSTDEVLQKHYIDERIVSNAVRNFRIFDQ